MNLIDDDFDEDIVILFLLCGLMDFIFIFVYIIKVFLCLIFDCVLCLVFVIGLCMYFDVFVFYVEFEVWYEFVLVCYRVCFIKSIFFMDLSYMIMYRIMFEIMYFKIFCILYCEYLGCEV